MELVKGSAHALVYETGLLIGHTHILFYIIFQLLVQKHKISTIKGVSFICATDVDNLRCPFRIILSTVANTHFLTMLEIILFLHLIAE